MPDFRQEFLRRFEWVERHADVLGPLADADFLVNAVGALASPFAEAGVTKVAAVEARGFILGAGVALSLRVGFVPIRKAGSIHPGRKLMQRAERDWRGNTPLLTVQRAALRDGDQVLVVDDWAERAARLWRHRGSSSYPKRDMWAFLSSSIS